MAGGGLIGDGHPVGATGVRQVAEAWLHLTNRAGERQIPGAKRFLTFNVGGSVTTSVVMIWGLETTALSKRRRHCDMACSDSTGFRGVRRHRRASQSRH